MTIIYPTNIQDIVMVMPDRHDDNRGWFSELYSAHTPLMQKLFPSGVVQVSMSESRPGVVRGLHFQHGTAPMAKLMLVVSGMARVVSVDLRQDSPTFMKYMSADIHADMGLGIYAPAWAARGFASLMPNTTILYLHDAAHHPADAETIHPIDPELNIAWFPHRSQTPILSEKDASAQSLLKWVANPLSASPVFQYSSTPLFDLPTTPPTSKWKRMMQGMMEVLGGGLAGLDITPE